MNTGALGTTFPFTSADLTQDKGILYGINMHNSSLVIFDRFSLREQQRRRPFPKRRRQKFRRQARGLEADDVRRRGDGHRPGKRIPAPDRSGRRQLRQPQPEQPEPDQSLRPAGRFAGKRGRGRPAKQPDPPPRAFAPDARRPAGRRRGGPFAGRGSRPGQRPDRNLRQSGHHLTTR